MTCVGIGERIGGLNFFVSKECLLEEIHGDLEQALREMGGEMGEAAECSHLKRMVSDSRDGAFLLFVLELREVIRKRKKEVRSSLVLKSWCRMKCLLAVLRPSPCPQSPQCLLGDTDQF